jgi:polyferredoxin
MIETPPTDVLRWPVIGPFLRWSHARTSLQLVLLCIAAVLVLHGLFGPQLAPANASTVLSWVHYRGLLVVALVAAGNFFCTGCPFVLVRDAGRRLRAPSRTWPRSLRRKWIGIALVVAVLFAYELFDLWALPRATAWLVLGYFMAALAVDLLFTGATFCKYLCPIGQFSFAGSTLSPLELRVIQPDTCRTCRTVDCIRGRRDAGAPGSLVQRGCELALFLPSKVGNLDCTFCLDCVHACPHDNIALAARTPGLELTDNGRRSGIGRLSRRPDIAVLFVVVVFGGLLNAFGMSTPAHTFEHQVTHTLGVTSGVLTLALLFVTALVVAPILLLGSAGAATAWLTGASLLSCVRTAASYAPALVPVGCGVWLSHYGFHLLTGALTIVPVTQSAAIDLLGWAALGTPMWGWTGMQPGWVFPIEVGVILLGAIGSLGLAYLISVRDHAGRAWLATLPWAAVTLALALAAVWILSQPMQMRGLGAMA